MPLVSITTNKAVSETDRKPLLSKFSAAVADMLGKPERFVMVTYRHDPDMLFGGDDAPLVYIELKSIGLPRERTKELSAALCKVVSEGIGVFPDRTYIEFADAERHMWGWNSGTF